MAKFKELTKTGREFVVYMINERLKCMREVGLCAIEVSDEEIKISSAYLPGDVVRGCVAVADSCMLSSCAYAENDKVRIKIY